MNDVTNSVDNTIVNNEKPEYLSRMYEEKAEIDSMMESEQFKNLQVRLSRLGEFVEKNILNEDKPEVELNVGQKQLIMLQYNIMTTLAASIQNYDIILNKIISNEEAILRFKILKEKEKSMEDKDYETHARSNESLQDAMDGKLNEPKSQESKSCEGNCDNCSCDKNVQSAE